MERFLLLAVFCIIWTPFASAGDPWNYTDQKSWGEDCNSPSSEKQTPINIDTTAAEYSKDLGAFTLKNFDEIPTNTNFTASNNGHSLTISFPDKYYTVSGGGLPATFTTAQFHLHWGSNNTQGSEHFMDDKKFAAELHFVNYNVKYPNISKALKETDGLAVLGVFIEVGGDDNPAYKFLDYSNDVVYKGDKKTDIKPFKFLPMLPTDKSKYYRYQGSLTTPGCYESVTWTVFKDVVKISQNQMNLLRKLKDYKNNTLQDNYREIQPLHSRKVKVSFTDTEPTKGSPTADASAIKVTFGLSLLMLIAAIFVR